MNLLFALRQVVGNNNEVFIVYINVYINFNVYININIRAGNIIYI